MGVRLSVVVWVMPNEASCARALPCGLTWISLRGLSVSLQSVIRIRCLCLELMRFAHMLCGEADIMWLGPLGSVVRTCLSLLVLVSN